MRGRKNLGAKRIASVNKVNPHTLRQLLYEIIEHEFQGDRGLAAQNLEVANPIKGKAHPFTKDIISNLIDDRTPFKYSHLEALANHYKIPTFMILLFSRLRSEAEKSPDVDIGDILEVKHLVSFLQSIEESLKHISFSPNDLRKWSQQYNKPPET